jgi:shikimate kinase
MQSPGQLPSKIILIGFMSSGKSSVAQELANRLGLQLIQTDDLIVKSSGYLSIPAIFSERGESHFRDLEESIAKSLSGQGGVVISTGGGIITRPTNMEHLTKNGGVVVFLRATFDTIASRIGDISSRPLFKDPESARTLFITRAPIYESYANITVDTDERTITEVCEEIIQQLQGHPPHAYHHR